MRRRWLRLLPTLVNTRRNKQFFDLDRTPGLKHSGVLAVLTGAVPPAGAECPCRKASARRLLPCFGTKLSPEDDPV
jgi:hypothetical protein